MATTNSEGLVKVGNGLFVNSQDKLIVNAASESVIKQVTNNT